jgi:hypothetical protein
MKEIVDKGYKVTTSAMICKTRKHKGRAYLVVSVGQLG